MAAQWDAIVLAGGLARRLEGVDKPALRIGDSTLLDRVLAACAEARSIVCVGPERPTRREVRWTREDPPGSGPVAALAAGLSRLPAIPTPYVAVLAADLPFLTAEVIHTLWTHAEGRDGAVLTDQAGKDQWLAACYRTSALTGAVARLVAEGTILGQSLKRLLTGMDLARVPDPDGQAFDCDTWEDVAHVRGLVDGGGGDHRPPRTESER